MSSSPSVQSSPVSGGLHSDAQHSSPMESTQAAEVAVELTSTVASRLTTPPDAEIADPSDDPKNHHSMATMMEMPLDARSIVRLLQCQQCSFPLRAPVTLPCGNSLCSQYCIPERFKRENISFPMSAARMEGFICPFRDCGQEHSVADCSQDVTLTKMIERVAMEAADFRRLHDVGTAELKELIRPRTEMESLMQAQGSSMLQPHTATLSGGSLAAIYTMAEGGLLRYDSDVVYDPLGSDAATQKELADLFFTTLSANVRTDADCQLCWNILYEPLTTPCGHTFCRNCVARMLDHSQSCPFCRKPLQLPPGVRDVIGNKRVQKLTQLFWSEELAAREETIIAEKESLATDIPIFVCTLAYPGMPTFLHIFEPRYRLMMRRVVESESKIFGMVMYNSRRTPQGEDLGPNCHFMRQGTFLRIDATAMLPDGRSLIQAHGVGRFSTLSWRESDGYIVGRTERIEDVSLEAEERLEAEDVQRSPDVPPTDGEAAGTQVDPIAELEGLPTAELLSISTEFVRRMRGASAPWLRESTLESYGQPPVDDARQFPYWFASVLPISEEEKYDLLGTTSVRERLKKTARWVRTLEAQRWYSVSACSVA